MDTLHVRSVPEDLYRRLRLLARARNRSISAQVVEMLAEGIAEEERKLQQKEVLAAIRRRRFTPPAEHTTSDELLREDRDQ
jgi:plasmid stability protein